MIITTTKHGRQERDKIRLSAHLAKTENEEAILAVVGNCIAATISESIQIMEIYRDASKSGAKAALHHVTINPAKDIPREKLVEAAQRVRLELDRENCRPFAIVIHRKERAEPNGGSREHAHLVLGAVDAVGKSLDDSWTKVRTERVARELEYDFGENPLLGRHHKSVLNALCRSRPEVYVWLLDAFGPNPEKPQSAISPAARNLARSQNLNLPKAKAKVRAIWESSHSFGEFQAGLQQSGLRIVAGDKPGVWVILDQKHRLVGAANRILKIRRAQFKAMMETSNESAAVQSSTLADVSRPGATPVGSDKLPDPENRSVKSSDQFEFRVGGRGRRSPADHRPPQPAGAEWGSPRTLVVGNKGGTRLRNNRALARLRQLDFQLLKALTSMAQNNPRLDDEWARAQDDLLVHKDLWGIVILPKPR